MRFLIFRRATALLRGLFARSLRKRGVQDAPALKHLRRARRDPERWRKLACFSGEDES
jgi:hypothetical protein